MVMGLFQQGPMSDLEAKELEAQYIKKGRKVWITDSFDIGLKIVQVYLPESKYMPRQSNIYQQKIWK